MTEKAIFDTFMVLIFPAGVSQCQVQRFHKTPPQITANTKSTNSVFPRIDKEDKGKQLFRKNTTGANCETSNRTHLLQDWQSLAFNLTFSFDVYYGK